MSATQDHDDATAQDDVSTQHSPPLEDGISSEGIVFSQNDSSSEDETSTEHRPPSTDGILSEDNASAKQEPSPEDSNNTSSSQDSFATDASSSEEELSSEIDTVPTQNLLSDIDTVVLSQDLLAKIDTTPTQGLPPESDVLAENKTSIKRDDTTKNASPRSWHVPYRRNPFFSGREDVLQQLHQLLTTQEVKAEQPLVISGLSGIGKTQVALEYVYRYRQAYTHIFWMNAASEYTLLADFIAVASIIGLPLATESLPAITPLIQAWLAEQKHWLMIFDNVNELEALQHYTPQEQTTGRILYISNAVLANKIQAIELPLLEIEQSMYLLLRRTQALTKTDKLDQAPLDVQMVARDIVNALDSFPFAVAQAAAYIEATGCDFAKYLKIYEKQRQTIVERGKYIPTEHAEPTMVTGMLFLQSLGQDYPVATELLCLCAFLATDTIPEDLITRGVPLPDSTLSASTADTTALTQAIDILCRFSLVQRYSDGKMLNIHPLIQTLIKHEMSRKTQREWAERALAVVDAAFPDERTTWQAYQPYIHQVQASALLIDSFHISSFVASKLLNNAALALKEHKQYEQAGPLFERALIIEQQIAGVEHPTTAITLNNLAALYHAQHNYERAEPCYLKALTIWELEPGLEYPSLSVGYDNLALLYQEQGKYDRVEAIRQRALMVTEQVWGMVAPETANCINNLANLYHTQGKYEEAEKLYRRSLAILLKVVGTDHAATATSLNNLANLYRNWEKDQQAGPLLHRALLIREKVLGPDHLETASSLSDLAILYLDWGRYQQAEQYLLRALEIVEQALGTQHSQVAFTLFHLARCYLAQGKNEQTESLLQRIITIDEQIYGPEHPVVASDLENYAEFLLQSQRQEEAKPFQARARAIRERQQR